MRKPGVKFTRKVVAKCYLQSSESYHIVSSHGSQWPQNSATAYQLLNTKCHGYIDME